jgi:YbbR domain-containing protein
MGQYGVNSNTVSVTVSGPPETMAMLEAGQIHATVDLSDFDDKTREMDRQVDVAVPWGVTVINVEPARVKVVPPKK